MTAGSPDHPIRWTFVVPGLPRPAGGLIAVYEHANAMAASGRDHVQVVHLPTPEARLTSAAEIPWFAFDASIEHRFLAALEPDGLPAADVLLYTVMAIDLCRSSAAGDGGARLTAVLQSEASPAGLPMLFVQALGVFPPATELAALGGVGPKVCVAGWIATNLVRAGLPAAEVVHVQNGIDHDVFRLVRPIRGRPARVAMNYNPHPLKNMDDGIEALARVEEALGVPSILFGTRGPAEPPTDGMRFVRSPRQADLSESVLAESSIYLQPSSLEGFGLCAIEAMACGCALVTTANGGSADYAIDGETAIVCDTDPAAMADAIAMLVRDDERRIRIATGGLAFVDRFRWVDSARRLRDVAGAYLSDPSRYRRGQSASIDPAAFLELR